MASRTHPSHKTLAIVWVFLVGCTLASMMGGQAGNSTLAQLPLISIALLLGLSVVKADLILSYFLNLQSADGTWRTLFRTVLILLSLVLGFLLCVKI